MCVNNSDGKSVGEERAIPLGIEDRVMDLYGQVGRQRHQLRHMEEQVKGLHQIVFTTAELAVAHRDRITRINLLMKRSEDALARGDKEIYQAAQRELKYLYQDGNQHNLNDIESIIALTGIDPEGSIGVGMNGGKLMASRGQANTPGLRREALEDIADRESRA